MLETTRNRNRAKFRVYLAPRITEPDLIPVGMCLQPAFFLLGFGIWKLMEVKWTACLEKCIRHGLGKLCSGSR